jgi:hypothetical protein
LSRSDDALTAGSGTMSAASTAGLKRRRVGPQRNGARRFPRPYRVNLWTSRLLVKSCINLNGRYHIHPDQPPRRLVPGRDGVATYR